MHHIPPRPPLQPAAPFCPLYRAEYTGELAKITLKIQNLPTDIFYIEGLLLWHKQPILLRARLAHQLGRFTLTAYLEGSVLLTCRHTGKRFSWKLQETVTETLNIGEEEELFDHGMFNIAEWTRQQVELAIPAYPQSPNSGGKIVTFSSKNEKKNKESSPFSILKCLLVA